MGPALSKGRLFAVSLRAKVWPRPEHRSDGHIAASSANWKGRGQGAGSRNFRRASCSGALMGQRGIPPAASRPAKSMLDRRHVGLARNKGLQPFRPRILNPVKGTTTYSIKLSASAGSATAPRRLASREFAERQLWNITDVPISLALHRRISPLWPTSRFRRR